MLAAAQLQVSEARARADQIEHHARLDVNRAEEETRRMEATLVETKRHLDCALQRLVGERDSLRVECSTLQIKVGQCQGIAVIMEQEIRKRKEVEQLHEVALRRIKLLSDQLNTAQAKDAQRAAEMKAQQGRWSAERLSMEAKLEVRGQEVQKVTATLEETKTKLAQQEQANKELMERLEASRKIEEKAQLQLESMADELKAKDVAHQDLARLRIEEVEQLSRNLKSEEKKSASANACFFESVEEVDRLEARVACLRKEVDEARAASQWARESSASRSYRATLTLIDILRVSLKSSASTTVPHTPIAHTPPPPSPPPAASLLSFAADVPVAFDLVDCAAPSPSYTPDASPLTLINSPLLDEPSSVDVVSTATPPTSHLAPSPSPSNHPFTTHTFSSSNPGGTTALLHRLNASLDASSSSRTVRPGRPASSHAVSRAPSPAPHNVVDVGHSLAYRSSFTKEDESTLVDVGLEIEQQSRWMGMKRRNTNCKVFCSAMHGDVALACSRRESLRRKVMTCESILTSRLDYLDKIS